MSDPTLKYYEFFAGGGMVRLGLQDSWTCIFANDFSPKKARSYRENFPPADELVEGDVFDLTTRDLPSGNADMAWASFPCQDLSLAAILPWTGRRKKRLLLGVLAADGRAYRRKPACASDSA